MKDDLDVLFGKARFIGINPLAEFLGMSAPAVKGLVTEGKLRACRIGVKIMFHRPIVEAYVMSLTK